jgi:diaminohydroxyphosphoribosylaminopyrimidine deaminase/5-amino-6-(5-phosphoribosylamino)uracil reductase
MDGRVDLKELMTVLGEQGIDSILLEGGATLNWAALNSGIVNEVHTYISPQIFGGDKALSPVAGAGVKHPGDGFRLKTRSSRWIGEDILIESEVL